MMESQAGAISAAAVPARKAKTSSAAGVTWPDQHHEPEARDQRRDRHLDDDQQSAAVHDIGERPAREREQEHRQRIRNLDQRDDERVGIEAGHQPAWPPRSASRSRYWPPPSRSTTPRRSHAGTGSATRRTGAVAPPAPCSRPMPSMEPRAGRSRRRSRPDGLGRPRPDRKYVPRRAVAIPPAFGFAEWSMRLRPLWCPEIVCPPARCRRVASLKQGVMPSRARHYPVPPIASGSARRRLPLAAKTAFA